MTTRKQKTSLLRRYGWIAAAVVFGALLLLDNGDQVAPLLDAASATINSSLTLATFTERMMYIALALALAVAFLRFFDRFVLGVAPDVWQNKIKTNPQACAIYAGVRFLAVCVLIGLILS